MAHYIIDDRGVATFYKCSNCGFVFWDMDDERYVNPSRCNKCGEEIDENKAEYVEDI